MIDEFLAASPRRTSQITMAKGSDQQLRLVQPRCMPGVNRGRHQTPQVSPVGSRVAGGRRPGSRTPLEPVMPTTEEPQLLDVVLGLRCGSPCIGTSYGVHSMIL